MTVQSTVKLYMKGFNAKPDISISSNFQDKPRKLWRLRHFVLKPKLWKWFWLCSISFWLLKFCKLVQARVKRIFLQKKRACVNLAFIAFSIGAHHNIMICHIPALGTFVVLVSMLLRLCVGGGYFILFIVLLEYTCPPKVKKKKKNGWQTQHIAKQNEGKDIQ